MKTITSASLGMLVPLVVLCQKLSNPTRAPGGLFDLSKASNLFTKHLLLPAGLFILTYSALLLYVTGAEGRLPKRLATHFGASGVANGWMTVQEHITFTTLMPLGIAALLMLILGLSSLNPASMNLPHKDYWMAPERRRAAFFILAGQNLLLSTAITLFFASIHWSIMMANQSTPPKLTSVLLFGPVIGFVGLMMLWSVGLVIRFSRTEGPETPTQPMKQGNDAYVGASAARVQESLSGTQRFFQRWTPAHWFEAMKAESQKWHLVCECGHATSIWDRGGIRFGAAGKPIKLMSCPACHGIKLHRAEWRGEGGPDNPAKGSLRAGAIAAAVWVTLALAALGIVFLVEVIRHGMRSDGMVLFAALLASVAPILTGIWRGSWLRGFAISAFILALPCILIGGFFVYSITLESGGWHPAPAEAFIVPLSFIGALFFPIAGITLWHGGRPTDKKMGCGGLLLTILAFVLVLLLIMGGVWFLSYRKVSQAVQARQAATSVSMTARLQGTWRGVEAGRDGECVLTVKGNTVHFQGVTEEEWYRGTFELQAGTNPQQFRAVITECPFAPYVGKTSHAILAIDGDRLSFVGNEPGVAAPPHGFEGAADSRHFVLQRVTDKDGTQLKSGN